MTAQEGDVIEGLLRWLLTPSWALVALDWRLCVKRVETLGGNSVDA